jgi:hypothetical protein
VRNSLFVGMAALRANSVFDWTSHFLQAFANEAEGMEFEPLRQAVLPNVYDKTLGDPMLDRDDR